jgi:hypothetical protein
MANRTRRRDRRIDEGKALENGCDERDEEMFALI